MEAPSAQARPHCAQRLSLQWAQESPGTLGSSGVQRGPDLDSGPPQRSSQPPRPPRHACAPAKLQEAVGSTYCVPGLEHGWEWTRVPPGAPRCPQACVRRELSILPCAEPLREAAEEGHTPPGEARRAPWRRHLLCGALEGRWPGAAGTRQGDSTGGRLGSPAAGRGRILPTTIGQF